MEEILDSLITKSNHAELVDELMRTYGREIQQLIFAYVHNEAIAEDLTQEVFVKCYKSLPFYKGKSSIKTWLWRIAINHAKDYLKSWYNQRVKAADDFSFIRGEDRDSVEQTIIQQDEDAQLAFAVMQLPIKYREVIYFYYYEEYSIKEIAAVLEVNQNTIKTRLRKGKSILKEMLEGARWKNDLKD
ncbi:sigma-70 family RNA polymerase sigma factor [Ureibacillus aquaedulcis]|uniref:Sigma-70 family RNA polymerase sigma factor n=1 Tax=Ureibacillus aquaedulcis TaxID=3058421 RepID=A0ABT8GV04_9BACL|nr:sigma-70 family RNA polymerase sigma factor [Ureibacillus sp. BA0131]MDN4495245.1 sigma-70 family RNA polymerase sigma factor [Ureibacillus sp. BA0131]